MDTTYYTFQTRKIKVSGGADLVSFLPVPQPAPTETEEVRTGEVLDFDLCRRRLETRRAWKGLADAASRALEDPAAEEASQEVWADAVSGPARPRRSARRTRAPWAEILASALALGFVCLVGAVALLRIV